MRKLLTLVLVAMALVSCNNQNSSSDKDTKEPEKKDGDNKATVVGTWRFDRMEKLGPNTDPADVKEMEEKSRQMSATFGPDGIYYTLREMDGELDTVQSGRYEMIGNGKFIVTHREYSSDTVELLEISRNSFKVVSPEKDIIVFKRLN